VTTIQYQCLCYLLLEIAAANRIVLFDAAGLSVVLFPSEQCLKWCGLFQKALNVRSSWAVWNRSLGPC